MKRNTIFFVFSGLGLGNTTRNLAIIDELKSRSSNADIHVFTWGNGWIALNQKQNNEFFLHSLHDYKGRFFFLRVLPVYILNCLYLLAMRVRYRPKLVLLDSDYHFLAFIFRSFPLLFLGQSHDVVLRAKELGYQPNSLRKWLVFIFCEKLDSFVQNIFCDSVLVPSFFPRQTSKKFFSIPLIVRRDFIAINNRKEWKLSLIDSGSGLDRQIFSKLASDLGVKEIKVGPRLRTSEDFLESSAILCRGGLSSISECIAAHKFCLSLPITNHPEQEINALTLEKLGLGLSLSSSDSRSMTKIHEAFEQFKGNEVPSIKTNGAAIAAQMIIDRF